MKASAQPSIPRLCTYVVRFDSGMAPNPFYGWCTLAVCTPNHMNSRVGPGDWIAGFRPKSEGNRFLYAMRIDEVLDLNAYYHDPRFLKKRPVEDGNWKQRCGDNCYSLTANGKWQHHPNVAHHDPGVVRKDTMHAKAFVGREFYYLGRAAAALPKRFAGLVGGRGTKVKHDPDLVRSFLKWTRRFEPGVHDNPIDNAMLNGREVTMRCARCAGSSERHQAMGAPASGCNSMAKRKNCG